MTYFDNKMAVAGQLGLVQGYVSGLIKRVESPREIGVMKEDLEYVKKILEGISELLFEEGDI